jgi:hypothetical protein
MNEALFINYVISKADNYCPAPKLLRMSHL